MKISILLLPILLGLNFWINANSNAEVPSISTPSTTLLTALKDNQVDTQAYTAVRGSKISLIKPKGFTNSGTFSGFQQDGSGASIVVTELPGPYSQVTAGFNEASLKTRGITLIGKENITIDGYKGLLLQATQSTNSIVFMKWITVFGDEKETILIAATFPRDIAKNLSQPLKTAVTSAKWLRNKAVDPFADLKFAVTDTPNLKFAKRVQNALLYTKNGMIATGSANDPILVVTESISNVLVANQKQFAEKRITQTQQVKNLSIDTSKPITIDGLNGYEIIANATDVSSNTPTTVYQVMLFEGQSYYIIQGLIGNSSKAKYLPEFQKIATSFRKK